MMRAFEQSFAQHRIVDDEKFRSIELQFIERDKRTEQLSLADKTAIAAALQAQKEQAVAQNQSNAAATAKSEANFTKQIDQISTLIQSTAKAQDDKTNDIKDRLTRIEGTAVGTKETKTTQLDSNKYIMSIIALLFTAIMVYLALHKG
jgi:hypothetical protein